MTHVNAVRTTGGAGCRFGDLGLCSLLKVADDEELKLRVQAGKEFGIERSVIEEEFLPQTQKVSKAMGFVAGTVSGDLYKDCHGGSGADCGALGYLHVKFDLPETNPFESLENLAAGCAHGDDKICELFISERTNVIASSYPEKETAQFWDVDEKAVDVLQKACDTDTAQACHVIGLSAKTIPQLPDDRERIERVMLAKGCNAGHTQSCRDLGIWFFDKFAEAKEQDQIDAARQALARACDMSDIYSCHMVEHLQDL